MTATRSVRARTRTRWVAITGAATAALAVAATVASNGASGATPTTEVPTSAPTATEPATLGSEDFATMLATVCEGDTGQPLLADALQQAIGADGSNRVVDITRTCDVEFIGAADEALGRPSTNVEALIADPGNNVTPNQAQTDLLNAELAVYWRITDAWVQSQTTTAGPGTTTGTAAPDTAAPGTAAPDTAAPPTDPEAPATTGG